MSEVTEKEKPNHLEFKKILKEWIIPLAIWIGIMILIKGFIYDPCRVHGLSMYPTLNGDEFIIVNKWKYRVDSPQRGEIIIFHTKEKRDFIKRIIGIPGDRISIYDGKVYRNGKLLIETYIKQPTFGNARTRDVVVGKDELYVLGDNRTNSKDSRMIGPVKIKDVVGRADYVVYPFSENRALYK